MQFKHLLTLCFFALTCFFVQPALAQNKVITGKVTDKKDGSTLIGVSVGAAGGVGTLTGVDGTYKLSVPASVTSLNFSYIGYQSQTVALNGQTNVNVSLQSASTNLNEVVVIGYGTQRIKDATGSVASLSPKDFNKGVIATPDQLLQGRIAGVQVTPSSGEPGAAATINIRGAGSIRSNDNPLYVVDGIPLDNGGTSGGYGVGAGSSSARNPLAFINPADIENISVLKDASSAAIYGARGANGVILITTRKGRKGQGVQFSANTSIANTAKRYDVLGREDFLKAVASVGSNAGTVAEGGIDYGGNTDWQDQIFRTAISQNYNLGFGGASNTGSYRASVGYDDQQGIVKNSALKRLNGRINASQSFFKERLKFDLQSTFSNVKDQFAPITNNAGFNGSLIGAAIQLNPTAPVFDSQGRYFSIANPAYDANGFPIGNGFRNPVSLLNQIDDRDNINRYLNNLSMTVKLVEGLSYKGNFGADISRGLRKTFYDPKVVGFTDAINIRDQNFPSPTGNGTAIYQYNQLTNYTTEHTLNYDKKWSDNSSLTVLAGYSYQTFKNFSRNEFGFKSSQPGVLVKDYNDFQQHLAYPVGDSSSYKLQSYFARVNYSYKDRYIITGTLRRDGSSRFGSNNKYGNFPAIAAKWRISNESFMPKGGFFDDLSLRLNYGKTGNQEIPSYGSLPVKQINYNGNSNPQIYLANPDLKWQANTTYGAGIDFSILKGRLTGTVDYFNKSISDLLFYQYNAQPALSPYIYVNLPGNVINKGFEFALNYAAIQTPTFTWDVSYNMSFIKNTVENFKGRNIITGNIDGQGLSGAYAQLIANGLPLFTFNVPNYSGLDANGFGIYPQGIDVSSVQGSPNPKFTASLTNNFSYKNWSLSFFLNAATGFQVYNNTANAFFYKGNLVSGRNVTKEVAQTAENALNSGEVSTRFLEKGDFLRLSNATIGYTFPLKESVFKTFRLSLTGQNLFLITSYSGLDPEINTDKQRDNVASKGIDYTSYPKARIFTLGVNASF
ncbi:SusC/RagA family TonB-linked outer membrane protein [Mucilaginibacter phyllosphaerae]|uniref:Iron complex outermembrane receptor protein n=1 Tax=Mucilaginibacter phyllosphaerae TaxID=1812349 RepID=A0A4Y8A8H1_9SPHI|nr:SusC/RagA family TonB-linked outer membrane protein [Mucilaginibacter phyllosphaerae]MBB3970687.1 iron complex outermembrane receptor protein [Mucilaginibacter phyllosphaerae]TEW64688.1 SusC/RagA family TonB-linked outer membrane protein [Mucilaginibacter phyllosphaerae]GGH20286.1 SusC/RagA family TonB-linked outer membrane protein [Mucilaginibacter phyllosphaerae]